MDIDKITKTQLIKKLIEQQRKIRTLEGKPVIDTDFSKDTPKKYIHSFRSLLGTNSIGILTINNKGVITSCNDAILDFSGYNKDDLIGKYFTKRVSISTKDIPRYMAIFNDVLAGREAKPFQIVQNHNNGDVRFGEVYFGPILDERSRTAGFKIIVKDITKQKKLERQLKKPDKKIDKFIEASLDGIVLHDNGVIVKTNRSFLTLFNFEPNNPDGKDIMEFVYDRDREKFSNKIAEEGAGKYKVCGLKSTGSKIYLEASGRTIAYNGKKIRMEIFHDITELKKAEKKIKYLKFHDSLTELYNRMYLEKVLGNVYRERNLPLNFIICDLNGLKLVNDTFGCREGDKLLKRIAKILKYCARKEDIVARWGGDEFFILLPRSTPREVEDVVYKIRNICANTRDQKIPLNISMGISARVDNDQDFRKVIKEAEDNMYTNKLLERKSISNSIIASLERTLWEKSHETREHAERLKGLITRLGKTINLPQSKLDELVLLSALHDIGKVAVPDEILLKRGSLNREEWKIIKRHPEIGYNIAKATPQIAMVADDILAHHEWWDGSGYPQGLKEDEIPVNSLITSIVDAYDVMVMGRPYKEPVPVEDAKRELIKCSGTQFSPALVENFINFC
ncbi:MAG: diguanylate cyclase [Actinomycetia bacterium]|nr:diguanylate cyclase [Actinomycetes bacterium]